MGMRRAFPRMRRGVTTTSAPRSTSTRPDANSPSRKRGPWRSSSNPTGFPAFLDAARIRSMTRRCSAWVPWEKLRRATSIPARIMRAMTAGSDEAGPIVATILVRRTGIESRTRTPRRARRAWKRMRWNEALDRQGRHDLFGVPLHLHSAKDVLHPALAIDHERGPLDAPVAAPVQVLLLVRAVLARHRGVHVGEERERQVELLGEALMAQLVVQADAEHHRV